jgi:AraC-like DNA-binding protein
MKRGQDLCLNLPGLYVVHQNIPGKEVDFHEHKEHLLFFPLHGEIQVHLEKNTLTCGPGRMIYLPPNTSHSFDSSLTEGERLIVLIGASNWKKHRLPSLKPTLASGNQLCKELLFYLLLHQNSKHQAVLIETFVRTLAESLAASEPVAIDHLEGRAKDTRLIKALELLRLKVDEPPTGQELASHSGMSARNLNRLFLTELGLTPKQASTSFRIDHAKNLLLGGSVTVTEAAFASGYQSLSQFITVFRQVTGLLPSEIRRFGQK